MANIYVGFSYPIEFKLGAYAIKSWSGVDYSHVYIRFESSNTKVPSNVYHAAHGMVHFIEFENFKKNNRVIKEYTIELSDEDRLDILIECMYLSGEGYGYTELIKILFTDLVYGALNKNLITSNSRGYICSELVGKLLIDKLKLSFSKPTHLLKPVDIDNKLRDY
jgi:hypothetical protein